MDIDNVFLLQAFPVSAILRKTILILAVIAKF